MAIKTSELSAVAHALEDLLFWLRRQAPTELSSSTVTTLDTLEASGPLRISDLAQREAISQPGMTTLVNRLEAAGYAERIADVTDGRATLVRITAAGREVLAARHADRAQLLRGRLEVLDPADRAALVAALPAISRLISTPGSPA
ncbi:MAG: MarR family winged helix-turn-helix transcriptional regulator [Jatrophihabitans sp.]|uniref:MarR family winged helix-turn-helix transcriptional regulator n=1 Tax=Jatrophihabitans sp. TaxID=1932789 RepID=UPI003F7D0F7A